MAAGTMALSAGAYAENATIHPDANIFGFNGYQKPPTVGETDREPHTGWFRFGTNGEEIEIWKDTRLGDYGTYFNVVYLRNGILCGNLGNATMMNYLEFSIEDGRQLEEREFDVQGENAIRRMVSGAYNPDDDHVYGFSSNIDQSRWYFVKAPACNPEKTEIVREMPADYSLLISCCFSSADNHMYGVDVFGDFIRVDVHGNFEWIGKFDEMNYSPGTSIGRWESGMTYSPKDNAFIWNRQLPDYSSHLVRIEASGDHKWSLIAPLHDWDQFVYLTTTDTDGDDNGPVAPEFVSMDFTGTSLDGSIVYTMPTKLADGNDAPASMTWTAACGDKTQSGTAAPGGKVTVSYSGLTNGENNFTFRASAGDAKGASVVKNTWLGKDAPMPPTDVTLTPVSPGNFKLTWTAPEFGAHRGPLDASKLVYAIFLDGKQVGNATTECEADVQLPTDEATREYEFLVMAIAEEMQSEFARSNKVFTGRGYDVPYSIQPTNDDAAKMTIINVDNDKSRWSFMTEIGGGNAFYSNKDWDNPGDDYLITPPLWIEDTSMKYNIEFEVKYDSPVKPEEYFDVWRGSEPTLDGIREKRIAPKTKITSRAYYKVNYDFDIPSVGTYYIGIHYVGDPDQRGIYVRNINITKTDKPSAAEGISAEGGIEAAATDGAIRISGFEGKAGIYAADGRLAASPQVNGSATVCVPSGIYIVRAAGKAFKVYVK